MCKFKFWFDEAWRGAMSDLPDGFSDLNHPMVLVSWFEALAYCRWLTELFRKGRVVTENLKGLDTQGWHFTLPSEAEWEKAARGNEKLRGYPCGEDLTPDRANYAQMGLGHTSAVGCFPADLSPNGCMDMSGNVWEWCRNTYEDYPYQRDDREDVTRNAGSRRVFRGGSWCGPAGDCRCSYRYRSDPVDRIDFLGFRVVLVPSSLSPVR